ncbi:hypothetical protein QRD89_14735 [Halobacillus sp. ACCC02827]|uniref:YkvI family membrane protein n=1 Tax=Bacillaceae TaxID=186817 RepID=UPI0002A514DA|nr:MULTISPECIES: hypothetical protein [Bacillaceae]ELK47921.1 hypothetical protein D479_04705 [Halobacillus sp. BAB-2008]QHT47721.1 hypothetical protein M662_14945 [Bacillus sp. SB49]WJE14961.1 hypothetical protein QRD89_14735 [Halobacillus sp. ACCC02827]
MIRVLKIASAFIGIIVGAGFASGQEILQYFTSFGTIGTIGAVISTALFAYLGMMLTKIGTRLKAKSHKEAIYRVSGKYLGVVVDYVIIFTLFGIGVVMIAGAGSIPSQQFGLSPLFGVILMSVIVLATVMLNVEKVIRIIGSVTPFLVVSVVGVSIYSLITMDGTFSEWNSVAQEQPSAVSNWFMSSINYVSLNLALGASMSLLMGGNEDDERISSLGGLVGGLVLGLMIVLSHLAMFAQIEVVGTYDMPMLKMVDDLSPALGILYSIILFGMVFNTAVSMFFSLSARFTTVGTPAHRKFVTVSIIAAFILSFAGFTKLVSIFYPVIGYMGIFLILALITAPFRLKQEMHNQERRSA